MLCAMRDIQVYICNCDTSQWVMGNCVASSSFCWQKLIFTAVTCLLCSVMPWLLHGFPLQRMLSICHVFVCCMYFLVYVHHSITVQCCAHTTWCSFPLILLFRCLGTVERVRVAKRFRTSALETYHQEHMNLTLQISHPGRSFARMNLGKDKSFRWVRYCFDVYGCTHC